ncbi:hypothetical protein [Xylocopilactobacillus apis]|uniref:Uncharacterized protein n=1 Tax=Xylocopilactobacillus apis TaxID=2932183 RepID=A0AAU9DB92_9LACO|nr:hypothetical protein [Xylocopilactobacillus apis]BDR57030.1 hypothetical protein KIMC2_15920 [Xylocopilactobacillus apis]
MYNTFKKLLAIVTIIFIAVIGLIFVNAHQSEIFDGYKQIVSVERSNVNIKTDLTKIARETNSLIAQRIVYSKNNYQGTLENTFIPIGKGKLPNVLPLQKKIRNPIFYI